MKEGMKQIRCGRRGCIDIHGEWRRTAWRGAAWAGHFDVVGLKGMIIKGNVQYGDGKEIVDAARSGTAWIVHRICILRSTQHIF